MRAKKKGFTLIEIIAVISLILVVSSIAIPLYNKVVDNQKLKTDAATAMQLVQTAKTYYVEQKGKDSNFSKLNDYITEIYGEIPKSKYNNSDFDVKLSKEGKVKVSIGEKILVENSKLKEDIIID